MTETKTPRWDAIQSHRQDNIATLLRAVDSGETVAVSSGTETLHITSQQAIRRCHKLALSTIDDGASIYKYGEIIGLANGVISAGDWVHVHNLTSLRGSESRS